MQPTFELFDHTADLGLRVQAGDLPQLLAPAAEGLYASIGELVPGGPVSRRRIDLQDDDPALLLRDYLAELLILFEGEQCLATAVFPETFTRGRLTAEIDIRAVDAAASSFYREVKAVTYHQLSIKPIPGGLEATVILDI